LSTEPSYAQQPDLPENLTSVSLSSTDSNTQRLFDHAAECEANNLLEMVPNLTVVVEGGGYKSVWLETQPMGGAMYATRNVRLALNNQLVFMRTQRADGRLPGMVSPVKNVSGMVTPYYMYPGSQGTHSMLQGFYFATPAVDVAWFLNLTGAKKAGADAGGSGTNPNVVPYLLELRRTLQKFDHWLWSARNSSYGVLWLHDTADTGEDGSDKYKSIPGNEVVAPYESMDMMGYAYDAEKALARIARMLPSHLQDHSHGHAEGEYGYWTSRMGRTAARLRARLWRESQSAAYDREAVPAAAVSDKEDSEGAKIEGEEGEGQYVTTLVHNNLRAMWHGVFDQQMADAFIAAHLMNISEFWTPTPLPSIAVSDPRFQNKGGNDWSGPPEGLTFQRTIRGLETYGHHVEILMIGSRLRQALLNADPMLFPQQIDPFSSMPDNGHDCYGPMLLSFLEYTALTTGIAVRPALASTGAPTLPSSDSPESVVRATAAGDVGAARLLWTAVAASNMTTPRFNYTQVLGAAHFTLAADGGGDNSTFKGFADSTLLFECTSNSRVVTDAEGNVVGVWGVLTKSVAVRLMIPGKGVVTQQVGPNEEWELTAATAGSALALKLVRRVPFVLPHA
jgi:hypothetical protein